MALEDVVQGVQVTVKTDGVDDAKSKIGELDKAIGSLSKTAESAAGNSSGGTNAGIGGLSKAFSDLNTVSAQAFAQIAKSAATGDFTSLATMVGGPVAGSFIQAAESIGDFVKTQDSAILKTAAMAREFGTTPAAMQGIQEGFEGAGVSATGFERLVNRMSRQVQNDYAEMTRNIRTDSDTQEGAVLRLQAAEEKLKIAKGADPTQFQYQDKLREQKFAQIAVDQAEEAVRQQALKSIPHVTDLLKEGVRSGQQNADITEVSTKTLRESFESMARVGQGPASPVDVLKKIAEAAKSGSIDVDTTIKLLKDLGGMSRAAGLGGMDAVHEAEYLKKFGAAGIEAKQAGQSEIQQAGLADTKAAAEKATQTIAEWSRLTGLFAALMKTTAAQMSGEDSWTNTFLKFGQDAIKWSARLNAATNAAKPKGGETLGVLDRADRFWKELLNPTPTVPEKLDPKTGKPVGQHTEPWRETIGAGPAQIIHAPDQWKEYAKVETESVGSGPGKIIHQPRHYGDPEWQDGKPITKEAKEIDKEERAQEGVGLQDELERRRSVPAGNVPAHMGLDRPQDYEHLLRERAGGAATEPLPPQATPDQIKRWGTPSAAAPSDHPVTDFLSGIASAFSSKSDFLGSGRPAPAAPAAPAPTAPPININLNVTAPVSVNMSAGGVSATPGAATSTTSVPGKWDGGAINIPGFADGGKASGYDYSGLMGGMSRDQMAADIDKHPDRLAANGYREYWNPISQAYQPKIFGAQSNKPGYFDGGMIPGFADGGNIEVPGEGETEKYLWGKIKQSPQAIVDTLKKLGPDQAKGWLLSKGIKYGAEGLLAAAGFTPQGRVLEIGAGALANVLEPVTVGAADYNAGARQEEERGRAAGAHNLKEADEFRNSLAGGLSGDRLTEAAELRMINSGRKDIPGYAMGSIRGPGTGTSDSILARLSNGEFVMKDAAVRTYGEGFMHAINNMQIPPPKYAFGGMIPASSLPRFSEGGGMERPGSILNLHVGGEVFSGLKAPAAVADQLRKFAINQQTTQTGKKPSWAGA